MNYKPDIQEKILGIFTPVRCLSELQLQQYTGERMPAFEQHLIQQHLVDCELCSEAVEMFRRKSSRQKFEGAMPGIHEALRKEYFQSLHRVASPQKKARNLKKEKRQEKVLIYTWSAVLGALCLGGILYLGFHYKNNAIAGNANQLSNASGPENIANQPVASAVRQQQVPEADPAKDAPATSRPGDKATGLKAVAGSAQIPEPAARNTEPETGSPKPGTLRSEPKTRNPKSGTTPIGVAPDRQKSHHDSSRNTVHHNPPVASLNNDTDLSSNVPVREKKDSSRVQPHSSPLHSVADDANQPPTDPDEVMYTSAKNYLAQGNFENAISRFKFLASDAGNKYYQQAKFQLALCYKAKGRNGKARKLLKEIVSGGGIMKAQAEAALQDL